jgi:hypothetical protein
VDVRPADFTGERAPARTPRMLKRAMRIPLS